MKWDNLKKWLPVTFTNVDDLRGIEREVSTLRAIDIWIQWPSEISYDLARRKIPRKRQGGSVMHNTVAIKVDSSNNEVTYCKKGCGETIAETECQMTKNLFSIYGVLS